MNLLENRKIGVAVMVALMLLALFTGSQRSLSKLQAKAEAVFLMGAAGDGIGIQSDLNQRLNLAYNLVTIGRKYLPEENPLLQNVLQNRAELEKATDPVTKYEANAQLDLAVTDLYGQLKAMILQPVDSPYPKRIYDDFRSRNDTISHDPYNQLAGEFNQKLKVFPASVLSGLVGVEPIALYQPGGGGRQ